jgi:hypothetical protein
VSPRAAKLILRSRTTGTRPEKASFFAIRKVKASWLLPGCSNLHREDSACLRYQRLLLRSLRRSIH